jgi:hypothetical protein
VAGLYGGSRVLPPDPFAAVGGALSRDAAARYRHRAYRFRMTVVSTGFLDGALVEELADSVSPPVLTPPLLPVHGEYPTREVGRATAVSVLDELPPLSTSLVGRVVELADPAEAAAIARLPVPNLSRRYGRKGPELFVSYRTRDWSSARALADTLSTAFGPAAVFLDTDSIRGGMRIGDEIDSALASCRLMLVVIDHKWLDIRDDAGRRRLEDPDDWVRMEVRYGLRNSVLVLPVLWDGAPRPRDHQLPVDLRGLFESKALKIQHGSARRDLDQLVDDVRHALDQGPRSAR